MAFNRNYQKEGYKLCTSCNKWEKIPCNVKQEKRNTVLMHTVETMDN